MNKPMFPDAVRSRLSYPFLGDLQLNVWAILAIGLAIGVRWGVRQPWLQDGAVRGMAALLPLIPSYLYARRLIRWTNGQDEMQRRILQEALVFAAMWTVFLRMAMDLFTALFGETPFGLRSGLGVEGTFGAMCVLYIIGCALANRRYQ
jgi:hypothetical protein